MFLKNGLIFWVPDFSSICFTGFVFVVLQRTFQVQSEKRKMNRFNSLMNSYCVPEVVSNQQAQPGLYHVRRQTQSSPAPVRPVLQLEKRQKWNVSLNLTRSRLHQRECCVCVRLCSYQWGYSFCSNKHCLHQSVLRGWSYLKPSNNGFSIYCNCCYICYITYHFQKQITQCLCFNVESTLTTKWEAWCCGVGGTFYSLHESERNLPQSTQRIHSTYSASAGFTMLADSVLYRSKTHTHRNNPVPPI